MTVTENPFLTGNYGPVAEERTDTDLTVDGAVPAELRGRYLRIGPNPHTLPGRALPLVPRRRHGARRRARRRRRPVVPQPMGAHRRDRGGAG